jgi:hypothetical protein
MRLPNLPNLRAGPDYSASLPLGNDTSGGRKSFI